MIACIQKFYPPNLKKKNKTYVNHVLVEFTLTGLTCTYITPWGTYDMYIATTSALVLYLYGDKGRR